MIKLVRFVVLVMSLIVTGVLSGYSAVASETFPQGVGGISYASLPDEVALYLNDMVFARDEVVLPTEEVRILLPPGTFANTLMLTENGERVRNYRITPQTPEVYYSQAAFRYDTTTYTGGGIAYIVTWKTPHPDTESTTRAIKLEYLMSGASWSPIYDMQIIDDETVELAFFTEIQNTALMLEEATVYLVAGRVDLSRQVDQVSQVTMNQYAVGYENETIELPTMEVGAVDLQHIYPIGTVSAEPGDVVYVNLVDERLKVRRLHVWNAQADQEVDVIYKVTNDTTMSLVEGIVRNYQDNLFMGSDFLETTPPGSEGSITVGSLPDVRVRRTLSKTYHGEGRNDYYQQVVKLEIHNFGEEALNLLVLDRWEDDAWELEFSISPERQPGNLLRWELNVPAGEELTITYQFRTEN